MATLSFVTPEEFDEVKRELTSLRAFVSAWANSIDDDVDTATALRLTGIKSRTTLRELRTKEREQPGLITYRKEGRRAVYSRQSCIAYKLRHSSSTNLRLAS